eukprot:6663558-Pyramimonas_sp.AAC.1
MSGMMGNEAGRGIKQMGGNFGSAVDRTAPFGSSIGASGNIEVNAGQGVLEMYARNNQSNRPMVADVAVGSSPVTASSPTEWSLDEIFSEVFGSPQDPYSNQATPINRDEPGDNGDRPVRRSQQSWMFPDPIAGCDLGIPAKDENMLLARQVRRDGPSHETVGSFLRGDRARGSLR